LVNEIVLYYDARSKKHKKTSKNIKSFVINRDILFKETKVFMLSNICVTYCSNLLDGTL